VALFVMGIFSKKANNNGALASILIGFLITAGLIIARLLDVDDTLPNFLYVATLHFLICCLTLWVFSARGAHKSNAALADLVWTPQEFAKETIALRAEPAWQNYRYHGIVLIIAVIVILLVY
jgi:SSS family solute:Na+ symporter